MFSYQTNEQLYHVRNTNCITNINETFCFLWPSIHIFCNTINITLKKPSHPKKKLEKNPKVTTATNELLLWLLVTLIWIITARIVCCGCYSVVACSDFYDYMKLWQEFGGVRPAVFVWEYEGRASRQKLFCGAYFFMRGVNNMRLLLRCDNVCVYCAGCFKCFTEAEQLNMIYDLCWEMVVAVLRYCCEISIIWDNWEMSLYMLIPRMEYDIVEPF